MLRCRVIQTKNFNKKTDPKLICTCGNKGCDKRSVKQWVLNRVQAIRDDAKRPLKITSGGRCPLHPNEVHRTKPADHQNCICVDIYVANEKEIAEIIALGVWHGATAIGLSTCKKFVHLGWRDQDHITTWGYGN